MGRKYKNVVFIKCIVFLNINQFDRWNKKSRESLENIEHRPPPPPENIIGCQPTLVICFDQIMFNKTDFPIDDAAAPITCLQHVSPRKCSHRRTRKCWCFDLFFLIACLIINLSVFSLAWFCFVCLVCLFGLVAAGIPQRQSHYVSSNVCAHVFALAQRHMHLCK